MLDKNVPPFLELFEQAVELGDAKFIHVQWQWICWKLSLKICLIMLASQWVYKISMMLIKDKFGPSNIGSIMSDTLVDAKYILPRTINGVNFKYGNYLLEMSLNFYLPMKVQKRYT